VVAKVGVLTVAALCLSALVAPTAGAQETGCARDEAWAQIRTDWAADVLALTNVHRLTLGLSPLAPSGTLNKAAEWKAAHMANFNYFSHDDPTRSWDQRIRDCGYTYGAGENIAYGYRTPQEVVTGWLNSEGHRRNIENGNYKVLGVGAAVADNGRIYWVQNFGLRADSSVTQPAPTEPAPPVVDGTPPAPAPAAVTAPVAKDDTVTVGEDESLQLNPLANDLVGQGGELEVIYHEDPSHGSLSQGPNGTLTYTPNDDFAGRDTFYYWISDQFERTCGARVTIEVQPENDAPTARLDSTTVRPGRTTFVRVTANDLDVDGDQLVFDGLDQQPRFGSATAGTTDGVVTYRARRGTSGKTDTITYLVNDGNGGIALGTLRIRIRR
jgi:uncharacterized protein YkwD